MTLDWKLSDPKLSKSLQRIFANKKIPYDNPGFCDHPAFLAEERNNPRFLEAYALYIETKKYTPEYLASAKHKIQVATEIIHRALEEDERRGACIDISMILSRILERLSVWNYIAKTTLTITFPDGCGLVPQYFWGVDEGAFDAPHAIVVAPPFGIIDISVKHQPYNANQSKFLPTYVLTTDFERARYSIDDIVSPVASEHLRSYGLTPAEFIRQQRPSILEVANNLPSRSINYSGTVLKYVIIAVTGVVESLENMNGYKPAGKTAMELYEREILPALERK